MKFIAAILLVIFSVSAQAEVSKYRLASWNILCATCNPGAPIIDWDSRRDGVINKIKDENPQILALQEVEIGDQIEYVLSELGGYNACISKTDNSKAHTMLMVKSDIDHQCLPPIDLADNRQCAHALINGVHYYSCHFPLTDRLNTESTALFLAGLESPFVFMGDFNTHSGASGYPQNDAELLQYTQTREDESGADSFWNIDKIGTDDAELRIKFDRQIDFSYSDHPYLKAKFYSMKFMAVIINYQLETL